MDCHISQLYNCSLSSISFTYILHRWSGFIQKSLFCLRFQQNLRCNIHVEIQRNVCFNTFLIPRNVIVHIKGQITSIEFKIVIHLNQTCKLIHSFTFHLFFVLRIIYLRVGYKCKLCPKTQIINGYNTFNR